MIAQSIFPHWSDWLLMINVCPACGIYNAEKEIRPDAGWRALAVCPACGHSSPFLRLPLFVVTGASGTGKTTLLLSMTGRDQSCIHLESDILWRPEFNTPEDHYQGYRNLWLRMCKNIGQSGLPVVLYGSVTPGQFESCVERRYFQHIHTLALVCDPSILASRLRARPAWRASGEDAFIERMLAYNQWFIDDGLSDHPQVTLFDTTDNTVDETSSFLREWLVEWLRTGSG